MNSHPARSRVHPKDTSFGFTWPYLVSVKENCSPPVSPRKFHVQKCEAAAITNKGSLLFERRSQYR